MIETINNVNKEIAREFELPEDIVKKVNAFYWSKGIAGAIRSGEHTSIYIRGLGTLATSRTKVNIRIDKLIRQIRYFRAADREFIRKTREQYIEARTSELRLMLARRNEVAIAYKFNYDRYLEKKKLRQQTQNDRLNQTSMGQQTPNSNGPSEQVLLSKGDQGTS